MHLDESKWNKVKAERLVLVQLGRFVRSFMFLEAAADWHELMIPQCIMQPSIAYSSKKFDSQCSQKTHQHQITQTKLSPHVLNNNSKHLTDI